MKNTIGILGFIVLVVGVLLYSMRTPHTTAHTPDGDTIRTVSSVQTMQHEYSNQWYLPIETVDTAPVYAMPLAYKVGEQSIGISTPQVTAGPETVFAPYTQELQVVFDRAVSPEITSVGDWTVEAELFTGTTIALGHGLPYSILVSDRAFSIEAESAQEVTPIDANTVLITTGTTTYIVVGTSTLVIDDRSIRSTAANHIVIGALPDEYTDEVIDAFTNLRGMVINNSIVSSTVTADVLEVTYTLSSNNQNPLLTLYPHHVEDLADEVTVLGMYETLRGPLQLIAQDAFTTQLSSAQPAQQFMQADTPDWFVDELITDIDAYMQSTPPPGVYFKGAWLATGASLFELADAYNLTKEKNALGDFLQTSLVEGLSSISYDPEKQSMIASNAEFGNEVLNDHVFHYGYYIRTAAVLSRSGVTLSDETVDAIELLIRDIANPSRTDSQFPYTRGFDWYEGHSWADGEGFAPDGNNQESTSEAINGWYSVWLWATATEQTKLADHAFMLYRMEIQGARAYWFNTQSIYPAPYEHAIASLVWGGKADYLTWFSPEANMKYGIQLLPFTAGSSYLGDFSAEQIQNYKQNWASTGGSLNKPWGNFMNMWFSLYEPVRVSPTDRTTYEDQTGYVPFSLYVYWLSANAERAVVPSSF